MSDDVFFVRGVDGKGAPTGFVSAKFMRINGQPVVDPTPRGSQHAYFYADDQGNGKFDGSVANPNNYVVVPAGFSEGLARDYASQVAKLKGQPLVGPALAMSKMALDFRPGGSQDLQRGTQWGIPDGSTVNAFVSGASHYLGFVNRLAGIPLEYSEIAGGLTNGGKDRSGPHGLSQQNLLNLSKGYSDASQGPEWMTNEFGYPVKQAFPAGQIGGGSGAAWTSSLRRIDPANPASPSGPTKPDGPLGIVSNAPMPDWPIPPPIFNVR